jgi:glutathione S-transferase
MTASIKIYGAPPSTFTRAVRMGCHEKGIDYELVPTFPSTVGPLNPFGKIPVMTHGDMTLYESSAILRYLDGAFPGPKLWPADARAAALVDQWVGAACDSLLNSAQRYLVSRFNFLPVPAEMAAKYLDKTREVAPAFDRQLGKTKYLAGDALTAADLVASPQFFYFPEIPELRDILDAQPNCRRWMDDIAARPSFAATMTPPEMKPKLAN